MNALLKADLFRYQGLSGYRGLFKGFSHISFRYVLLLRLISSNNRNSPLILISRLIKRRYDLLYGFQIPARTKIGEGFYIGHFGTIVINENAVIGKNCNITHNVTIGRTNRGKFKGSPIIGDKVWIGTGSVIVGKISIGNNVLIAPNSYVNVDVPENSLVIGNPCKIIPKENATDGYINYCLTD